MMQICCKYCGPLAQASQDLNFDKNIANILANIADIQQICCKWCGPLLQASQNLNFDKNLSKLESCKTRCLPHFCSLFLHRQTSGLNFYPQKNTNFPPTYTILPPKYVISCSSKNHKSSGTRFFMFGYINMRFIFSYLPPLTSALTKFFQKS